MVADHGVIDSEAISYTRFSANFKSEPVHTVPHANGNDTSRKMRCCFSTTTVPLTTNFRTARIPVTTKLVYVSIVLAGSSFAILEAWTVTAAEFLPSKVEYRAYRALMGSPSWATT